MTRSFSRREALKWGGIGAAALMHPPLIAACSSSRAGRGQGAGGSGGGGAGAGGGGGAGGWSEAAAPFEIPVFDPEVSWWTQYNYASVDEREETELEIEGAIPPELDGLYVRNGSNPASGDPGHWFLGDGMLHGVRIQGGRALWYRNRYIRTQPLLGEGGTGLGPPTGGNNASNVSVVHHAGHLLTSGEVGFPYEIDPTDLGTRGVYDFGGALTGSFTAHPKIDAVTGEMLMFGYNFGPPFVTYHRVSPAGVIVQSEGIDLPASVMMHDFQITATRVVFMDLPIIFDLDMALTGNSAFPFRWEGSNGARLGIMPRTGTNADVRWFEIDSCFIFHTMNAYDHPDKPDTVVLIAARHPPGLWASGPSDFESAPVLYRYEIDLVAGRVTSAPLDDRMTEFVQLNRQLVGRPHRYGYGVWLDEASGGHPGKFRGILKWDFQTDAFTAHELPASQETGEPYFVPASADAGEDDGYLMTFVYDWASDRSDLVLFDASQMSSDPIARVKLPFRVPFGFHGMWVPA